MWYYVIYWYKTKTKHCSLSSLHCTKWEWRKLHVFILKKKSLGVGKLPLRYFKKKVTIFNAQKSTSYSQKNNQLHMLHSSILAKTCTANWNVSCLERLITHNTQNTGLRSSLKFPEFWDYRINQQYLHKEYTTHIYLEFQFPKLWLALATSFSFQLWNGYSANCKSGIAAQLIRDGGNTSTDTLPVPRWMMDAALKCSYSLYDNFNDYKGIVGQIWIAKEVVK